jgi:uncharacterized protein (DUF2141 family)
MKMKNYIRSLSVALALSSLLSVSMCGCSSGSSGDDPDPSEKAVVEGTILLPLSVTDTAYKVIVDSDADGTNGATAIETGTITGDTISYSISDVDAGTYYVYCLVDVDGSSGAPNTGDYFGVYAGKNGAGTFSDYFPASANVTVPSTGTVSFSFVAYSYSVPTGSTTVSGTVSLPASVSNKTYYVVIDANTSKSDGYASIASGATSGSSISYTLEYVDAGTYYIYCLVDVDGSGAPTANDYFGAYGGTGYNFPSGANLVVPASGTTTCDFSAVLITP